MQQRVSLIALGLLIGLHATDRAQCAESKPNMVFILADDMGWTDAGCFGSDLYRTPHIDRLAADGVRFTASYAACHVCSPTRASIMTGKYPARLRLTDYIPGGRDRRRWIDLCRRAGGMYERVLERGRRRESSTAGWWRQLENGFSGWDASGANGRAPQFRHRDGQLEPERWAATE